MKRPSRKSSLAKFAAKRAARAPQCFVCKLPTKVRREVDRGLLSGVSHVAIADWLHQEHGLTIKHFNIRDHRRNGHVEE